MEWSIDFSRDRFGLPRGRVLEAHVCGWRMLPIPSVKSRPTPSEDLAEATISYYEILHQESVARGDHIKVVTGEIALIQCVQVFTGRKTVRSMRANQLREDVNRWRAFRTDQNPAKVMAFRLTEERFDAMLVQAAGRGYEQRRLLIQKPEEGERLFFYPLIRGAEIAILFRDGGPLAD